MAGIGSGYDLSVSTFSPDGRIFQIEYAAKAADKSSTILGIVCKDGVIFAAEKFVLHRMTIHESTPRIFIIDKHIMLSVAGLITDGREIVRRARLEAKEYRRVYDEPIGGNVLASRLALFFHAYTLAWYQRPFGCAILLAAYESVSNSKNTEKPISTSIATDKSTDTTTKFEDDYTHTVSLYSIDTSGSCYKYYAAALGKGKQLAKTEIEKLDISNLSCDEMTVPVSKIMHIVHEETRERDMELEIGMISKSTQYQAKMLEKSQMQQAYQEAVAQIEALENAATD